MEQPKSGGEARAQPFAQVVARPSLDKEFDDWLFGGGSRVMCLTGKPGTGKSVYARLVVERLTSTGTFAGVLYEHSCRARDDASTDPLRFVEALSATLSGEIDAFSVALTNEFAAGQQIIGTASATSARDNAIVAGVYIRSGEASARRVFDRLVRRPMQSAKAEGFERPVLIVVDGLDEALSVGGTETIPAVLAPLLSETESLPENVRLFLTFRSGDPRLSDFDRAPRIDLDDRTDVEADLTAFVRARLGSRKVVNVDSACERILAAADGNFLLAYHTVEGLEIAADGTAALPPVLPKTLEQVYDQFLARELMSDPTQWMTLYRPVLGLLAVANGAGLQHVQLRAALDISAGDLDLALLKCLQFLERPDKRGPFTFFHQSFREYLLDPEAGRVDACAAHEALSAYLMDEHDGAWDESAAAYATAFLIEHVGRACAQASSRQRARHWLERGAALLGRPDFVLARIVVAGPSGYLVNTGLWQGLRDYDRLDEALRERLSLLSEAIRLSGEVLAAAPEQFVANLWARLPRDRAVANAILEEAEAVAPPFWLKPRTPFTVRVGTPVIRTFQGRNCVNAVVASAHTGRMALGNDTGEVIVFDIEAGVELKTFETGSGRWIPCGVLHPDGKTAIFGIHGGSGSNAREGGAIAIDLETLETLWCEASADSTYEISVSRDGTTVACANPGEPVVLRSARTGEELHRVRRNVNAAVFLADSSRIVTAGARSIAVGTASGTAFQGARWCPHGAHRALALDDAQVAFSRKDGSIFVADFDAERTTELGNHGAAIGGLAWDGASTLFAVGHDGAMSAWDLSRAERIWHYRGHIIKIFGAGYAAGTLFTASKDCTVKAWNPSVLATDPPPIGFGDFHEVIALSPDGDRVAASASDGEAVLAEVADLVTDPECGYRWKAHRKKVISMTFDASGRKLATFGADHILKLWNLEGEPALADRFSFGKLGYGSPYVDVDLGRSAALVSGDEVTRYLRWERSRKPVEVAVSFRGACALAGEDLALGQIEGEGFASYDLANQRVVRMLRPEKEPENASEDDYLAWYVSAAPGQVSVSENGEAAIVAYGRGRIEIWDLAAGTLRADKAHHYAHVHALQVVDVLNAGFSAGLEDRELRIWSLGDGSLLCRIIGDGGWWGAAVSANGRTAAACDDDGGLKVFDVGGELRRT